MTTRGKKALLLTAGPVFFAVALFGLVVRPSQSR